MEKIEIRIECKHGHPVEDGGAVVFGIAGGTIGRSGHNKLVLPDPDAGVARVHAMVRLESDGAHIANLCERRSMAVDEQEVCSGEEIPLRIGAQISIGPYLLRALEPGAPTDICAPFAHKVTANGLSETLRPVEVSGPSTTILDTPNPWADIPQQLGDSDCEQPVKKPAVDSLATLLPHQTGNEDKNPFAILGRTQVTLNSAMEEMSNSPNAETPHAKLKRQDNNPSKQACANGEGKNGVSHQYQQAALHVTSRVPATQSAQKALVIPADFDPFIRNPQQDDLANDPWAGGLPLKTLEEVAKLSHDDLLQALPESSQQLQRMDNSAHAGLPRRLEPQITPDPLSLFSERESRSALVGDPTSLSQGSDLKHLFSWPQAAMSAQAQTHATQARVDAEVLRDLQATNGLRLLDDTEDVRKRQSAPRSNVSPGESKPLTIQSDELKDYKVESPAATEKITDSSTDSQSLGITPGVDHLNVKPSSTNPPDIQLLWRAFLDGAGVSPQRADSVLTPQFMRSFGEAFRIAVQGTIDLLAARSEIKKELRAGVTVIASGANNPLKFLPTADGVLLQMTGQHFPGFMQPVPAMQEAYRDLQVHQVALMAGIRAAYAEALSRFDPAEVEKRSIHAENLLMRVSATRRKAALWDCYSQNYNALRQNAEDDLIAFSGKTFVDAYEAAALAAGGAS